MIFCKELNREFANDRDLFLALKENEPLILAQKKSECKSIDKGSAFVFNQNEIIKSFENDTEKAFKTDNEHYYIVVNSADYLDSHKDLHVSGNWDKTVQDQQGKLWFIWSHEFGLTENIIAFPNDVEVFTANVKWSALGKNYAGSTYSLIYKVKKENIQNKKIKEWLESGKPLQASVRMMYIKVLSAFNTDDKDFAEQKAVFDKYYDRIVNKDEFEDEIKYFWVVKEAKNHLESSLLPFGSNSATGNINTKEISEEAVDNTSEIINEPSNDTQQAEEIPQKRVLIF